jgi:hypothetical protein
MTTHRTAPLEASLWTVQIGLAVASALSGILKAWVPATELQQRLGFMVEAQGTILRPVGLVEMVLAVALVVPAGARLLPRLTPLSALGLGGAALLGLAQPASGGGLGLPLADLALLAGSVFVAWGRLVAAPIEPASFGPEPSSEPSETADQLERNRRRHAARVAGTRRVA